MRCFCVWMMAAFCVLVEMPASAGEIRGAVTDRKGGGPLPGVSLHLIGTRWGAVSDSAGNYVISKVPAGTTSARGGTGRPLITTGRFRYYYNFDGRTLTRDSEKWFPLLPSLTVSGEF